MILRVSSTTARPISATVAAPVILAEAAWRTASWAARASVCSNSSAFEIAIAACVANVDTKATSPGVQTLGSRDTADIVPMTRSWWKSGATMSPVTS
jgi:hypothetical protein